MRCIGDGIVLWFCVSVRHVVIALEIAVKNQPKSDYRYRLISCSFLKESGKREGLERLLRKVGLFDGLSE